MTRVDIGGMPFLFGPHSVGFAGQGPSAAAGAIRMIREQKLTRLNVLDICCGMGVVGLLMRKELGPEVIASLALADINIFNLEAVRATLQDNSWDSDPTIIPILADGLTGIPPTCFDLIVSNPPHCPMPEGWTALDTPGALGTYDSEWRFHRAFYAVCHQYLPAGGQVWFLENTATDAERISRQAIEANPYLSLAQRIEEPEDPGFVWMITERLWMKDISCP